MPNGIAEIHWRLVKVEADVVGLREDFQKYRDEETERRKEEATLAAEARKETADEVKSDRRWRVGIVITVLGLIVSVIVAAQVIASSVA